MPVAEVGGFGRFDFRVVFAARAVVCVMVGVRLAMVLAMRLLRPPIAVVDVGVVPSSMNVKEHGRAR